MTASLPFTGERFTPEVKGAIWHEDWHRYSVMLSAARGRRVLDAACREGYGSWLLANASSEVVGIDIDVATIGHAVARYAARPNLRYIRGSCAMLPLATGSVDLIIAELSIFDDGAQTLYRDYERSLLAEKRLYWSELAARKVAAAAADTLDRVRRLVLEWESELRRAHTALGALAQTTGELDHTRNRLAFRETWRGWMRWPLALARQRLGKRSP